MSSITEIKHNGRIYFTKKELACKGTGIIRLAPRFADELLALRLELDEPMNLTSACRSKSHNTNVGGHPRSLHVCDEPYWPTGGCCAVDVGTTDPAYRARLIKTALLMGWSVGVHKDFIHLDRGADFSARSEPMLFPY
ncbi:D-Ala-D-Ala carboxypeptidase family metallohydrolase [Salinispirillum sp. LH 10-3-1]|uniref:D-Ala-D-Ala carboxypeptidase family metallohydrolase n=1 Tax=Salinispirillum sp. LH 10-3-1 TaxID=2952525 RepID=A0AB38YDD3_9GAMM